MKVEIWSDVMCPFCYIGKKKFETALAEFQSREMVDVEWKSFQLMPDLKTTGTKNLHKFLMEQKGMSIGDAKRLNAHVEQMAKQAGVYFDFENAIPANTFNAHRLLHFAKKQGKQSEAEEVLFRAYLVEGKNIDDKETLVQLGMTIGLDAAPLKSALTDDSFTNDVHKDIQEAGQLGVRGVPYFVFDRKYAISGAQDNQVFLQTLEKSFTEWQQVHEATAIKVQEGQACSIDGRCE